MIFIVQSLLRYIKIFIGPFIYFSFQTETALNALETGVDLDTARQMYKTKNKETKIKHQQINEGYQSLEKQIYQDESHPHFTDLRVYQLYAMAKKTNMSPRELESFEVK